MPTYTVTDPRSGQTKRITGASPPSEAELDALFTDSAAPTPKDKSWTDTAVDALPAIGGFAGSLVGAGKWNPLGMAGAAIGGAGGEFARQIVNAARGSDDVPASVGEQYAAAAKEAALQAGFEGGGRALLGGGARLLKGVRKLTLPTMPPAMKDLAVDAALDLVPGGRTMRGAARMAVNAIRGGGGRRAAEELATEAAPTALRDSAAPAIEGFERYLPNISAAHAAEPVAPVARAAMNGPKIRALSEGEEKGINALDEYFDWKHGGDASDLPSKGNGLYRALQDQANLAPRVERTRAVTPTVIDSDLESGRELGRLLQKLASGRGGR